MGTESLTKKILSERALRATWKLQLPHLVYLRRNTTTDGAAPKATAREKAGVWSARHQTGGADAAPTSLPTGFQLPDTPSPSPKGGAC
jgi:hypothetical protein